MRAQWESNRRRHRSRGRDKGEGEQRASTAAPLSRKLTKCSSAGCVQCTAAGLQLCVKLSRGTEKPRPSGPPLLLIVRARFLRHERDLATFEAAQNRHERRLADPIVRQMPMEIVDAGDRIAGEGENDVAVAQAAQCGRASARPTRRARRTTPPAGSRAPRRAESARSVRPRRCSCGGCGRRESGATRRIARCCWRSRSTGPAPAESSPC